MVYQNLYYQLSKIYQNELKNWKPPIYHSSPSASASYNQEEINDLIRLSDFTSLAIKKNIAKDYQYLYFIQYQNTYLYLLLKAPITSYWKNKIKSLLLVISTVQKYFKKGLVQLILIPTPYKKLLPSKANQKIGPHECNSGSTIFFGNSEKVIIIWRLEECQKVLLHELIHYNGIDKGINNIDLREAYTESLANIFHQLFTLLQRNKSYQHFPRQLKKEIEFSQYQLAKIIKYWYPLTNQNVQRPAKLQNKLSNETSVIGYYWIKTALISNTSNLTKYWKQNGWQMSGKKAPRYLRLVNESIKNEHFNDQIAKWITRKPPHKNWRRTLRMTIT